MQKFLFSILLFVIVLRAGYAQPTAFTVEVTGQGQPLLLIPGYSCSGEVWRETVEHLKDRYECHVLTLAGYAGVPPIEQPILQTVRDQIMAYVKAKNLHKPVLMGHSLGAFMSLWVSSTEPELFSKVICVDGVPFLAAMMNPNVRADSLRQLPMYNAETVAQNFVSLPDSSFEQNQARAMLTQVRDSSRARQIARWAALSDRKTLGYTIVELSLTDLRPNLARITAPTLVLGSLYFNSPQTTERILGEQYRTLPHKTIVVAQAKHFIMYDEPAWFYQQIDAFLGSL
ncbi:alpha/beta hydrolase [Rhabdobacter roseus]|uniref:Pimeloyl-ACP methyl ester carboxylesterase n=1 Tax=Rhabdobacter roseus TaxID=1655419 RepID=A0A840TZQ3_9BACT|nr:alpha/beta hydrolase [Rhabdobacter roseus]MBB5286773.1 pimeloyl-ACP methyl ester carboxylesterase [Rhabdobacter roseus]